MTELIQAIDQRGLIRDSYVIEGISAGECRSIFLDWALFEDHDMPQADRIKALLDHYGATAPDHPMTDVLTAALETPTAPKRRGGRKGRVG
ncbi:hypothetical protein SAMN04488030_1090 [Aliiroseovarius halocynthiae]|uniref:Uncharacterized protein n=1 Tax=Aliiroseovarius halocynthiae TaxID=985055 RepID=A0A545SVL7_9RHOB|nr:hypothetical protein [Aliiroseovarius halocynthiae]TQV69007.1 hypothetical protein FIL88_05400 [Aliiroseovarius halocynthiae]SMR71756.1 hypothetical protein SAMN04488030_1090 [Aliiroseovarius halocynthiae]